jgi:hypothetical protein
MPQWLQEGVRESFQILPLEIDLRNERDMSEPLSETDRRALAMHVNAGPPTIDGYVSCFWALVRDARLVAKRDPDHGFPLYEETKRPLEAIWGASLLYMVIIDQIGSSFETRGAPRPNGNSFSMALRTFGVPVTPLSPADIDTLYALRCSFAHDYSLLNVPANRNRIPQLAHLFSVTWSFDRRLVERPTTYWNGNTSAPLPIERTVVNLKAFEELVEGMIRQVQLAAESGDLILAEGMTVKEFTERYSFRITAGS